MAIHAINALILQGYQIFFCSRPNEFANNCIREKQIWIKKYFGNKFSEKIIFTYDKKMCKGDILIDDVIEYSDLSTKPSWKQILITTNHNSNIKTNLPRISQFFSLFSRWDFYFILKGIIIMQRPPWADLKLLINTETVYLFSG